MLGGSSDACSLALWFGVVGASTTCSSQLGLRHGMREGESGRRSNHRGCGPAVTAARPLSAPGSPPRPPPAAPLELCRPSPLPSRPQAAALLSHLLEARGAAAPPSPGTAAAIATPAQLAASQPPPAAPDSADSNGNGAHHHQHQHHANTGGIHSSSSSSSAEADDAVARALGALEAALSRSAGGSLAPSPSPSSPSSSSSSSSSSSPSSGWSLHRGAVLADPSDPCRTPHTADLLLRTPGGALLAVAVTLPQHQQHQQQGGGGSGGGDADAASRAVRRGKERLEWLCWLLLQDGGLEPGQVARVLLLAEGGRGGQGGRQQLPAGVLRYLRHSGVQVVWGRELEAGEGEGLGGLGLGALAGAAVQAMAGRRG